MRTMTVSEPLPVEPDLPVEPPDAYVEAMVRRASTSFFWGMRRLEPVRRRGVFAVYAFCRDVDDIADGHLPVDHKSRLLDAWRAEIELMFGGACHHPISRALSGPITEFDLRKDDFLAVVDGMEMDAKPRVRIADYAELALYCDRVACAVGRLCSRIFGLREHEGIALAEALGHAMQLTNILRDIDEDAARDRVYLPADLLALAGADSDEIGDILSAPGLPDLCDGLAGRAEEHFDRANSVIAEADARAVRPAVMMLQVYRRILVKLRQRGWNDLSRDVGPSKFEKLAIAFRYGLLG